MMLDLRTQQLLAKAFNDRDIALAEARAAKRLANIVEGARADAERELRKLKGPE